MLFYYVSLRTIVCFVQVIVLDVSNKNYYSYKLNVKDIFNKLIVVSNVDILQNIILLGSLVIILTV